MSHPLQCRCGTVRGLVNDPQDCNHAVCYCRDCQAFAHFLGRAADTLDERGGSEIIQVLPKNLTFTQGFDQVACMRLTPKGLHRWYTTCCNTPIGNTLGTPKVAFIGLLHNCLGGKNPALQASFGPIRCWVNPGGAKGDPKPPVVGRGQAIRWFLATVLRARLNGNYKQTPFFRADLKTPIVTPRVLTGSERADVMNAVRAHP